MLNNLKKKVQVCEIAWMCDSRSGCHVAHEECHSALLECRSALLECQMALGHAAMLTPWWADSSHFSNARFAFSHFLKNIYFVCDHETLS